MPEHVAIVTGAAGDIGQAIARRLLGDHDRVVLADRDLAGAEAVAGELGLHGAERGVQLVVSGRDERRSR